MLSLTPWDKKLFLRSVGLCALLACIVVIIEMATDEPGSTLGDRAVRLIAIGPLIGVFAVAVILGQGARRGEWVTLRACGLTPWAMSRGASAGSSTFAISMSLLLALPALSLRSLFPALPSSAWRPTLSGFERKELGMRWDSNQPWIEFFEPVNEGFAASLPRWATLLCFLALGTLLPFWMTIPCARWERGVVLVATVGVLLVELHGIAVGAPSRWLILPVLVPALHAYGCWRQATKHPLAKR